MTYETKNLFDAPWVCFDDSDDYGKFACIVHSSKHGYYPIASHIETQTMANRFFRLPELYDALMEAVYDACQDCLVERSYVSEDEDYDLIENGCVYPERDCCEQCRGWIELIRKVRDGK